MAQGKKSFVAYADWKETFDNLPDELAGKLIKHIFAYVNDENPITDDFVIKAVFPNIRNTLKRDLEKWENQLEQRREAGKRSAEIRRTKGNERSISSNEPTRNSTDNVSDSVSVSVSDSDNVILLGKETKNIFSFSKSLKQLGAEEQLIKDWLAVRKNKKATNTQTSFNSFEKQLKLSGRNINEVLTLCVEKSWSGFKSEWLKDIPISIEPIQGETDEDRARRQYIERIKNNDY